MAVAGAVRFGSADTASRRLYERIGAFLFDQRLEPTPDNYAFAYALLCEESGPLALAVAQLTEGGVRLTQRDIEKLGCEMPAQDGKAKAAKADGLVAKTQLQVEGFQDMVHAIRAETQHFGRDLAESVSAIDRSRGRATDGEQALNEVSRITATMIERVQTAESRLESATREASELRMKLEEARDNARRDPLTDLPNRRAIEEAFAQQSKAGGRMCLAICDVDHFKSVNDRFGHAVGDRVLKAIAEALGQACAGHLVARYGGEEFAVLFTGISPEIACATLDTARATVAAKRYRVRESDKPLGEVTFSAGVTAVSKQEAYQVVFQRADRLLYAAKTSGRNQVRQG